jgi:hypothetical protein
VSPATWWASSCPPAPWREHAPSDNGTSAGTPAAAPLLQLAGWGHHAEARASASPARLGRLCMMYLGWPAQHATSDNPRSAGASRAGDVEIVATRRRQAAAARNVGERSARRGYASFRSSKGSPGHLEASSAGRRGSPVGRESLGARKRGPGPASRLTRKVGRTRQHVHAWRESATVRSCLRPRGEPITYRGRMLPCGCRAERGPDPGRRGE